MPAKPSNSELLSFAKKLAKESGAMLLKMQAKAKIVKHKGKQGDFAMDADMKSEKHILQAIRKRYPNHNILTEESGKHHQNSNYTWIIDPLEGTLNYAHNVPLWAVNIGLFYQNKPLLGVVYAPKINELFHAIKGKGAYLNGKKIRVNKDTTLNKSYHAISSVVHTYDLSPHVQRIYGCAGLELCYVACGRLGSRIKLHGNDPYGYGAASIIIREAQGTLTDNNGKEWTLDSDGAIASNGKLHKKLVRLVSSQR